MMGSFNHNIIAMKSLIHNFISHSIEELQSTRTKISNTSIKNITIDNYYFHEKFMNEINISEFITQIKDLKDKNTPTLYWFELESPESNKAIRTKYINYRENIKTQYTTSNYRNTSAYKKTFCLKSRTLYVGKVEKGFWGRLVTHLGYNQSPKTAGMQLYHWYDTSLYGNLKVNYISFDYKMKDLITILEKQLARELKPLIGRY